MFNKPYETRLSLWREFRETLETSETPLEDCANFWRMIPEVSIQADPYDLDTWPDPWEMIEENIFCPFVKILAICYTLQLTERFSQSQFEIHIMRDKKNCQIDYLLFLDDQCMGYNFLKPILIKDLPRSLISEKSYRMTGIC